MRESTADFGSSGHCMRGEACWFKHSPAVSAQSQSPESSTPSSSQTSHDTPSQPSVTILQADAKPFVSASWPPSSHEQPAATSSKVTLDTPQEEEPTCIICFERPLRFGLLESCSHVYCVDCIRTWRSERNKTIDQLSGESGLSNLKNCPACRATSNYIIPSDVWFSSGPAKEAFIQSYKDRLSTIPCKHFERSAVDNRFCPFGKDCFYAHLTPAGTPHIFTHSIADHLLSTRRAREQRRLENHLRQFYRAWRSGRLPDGHDERDWWDESDDDEEDEYSDDEDEGVAPYGTFERAMYGMDEDEHEESEEDEDDWDDDEDEEDDEEDEEYEADLAEAIRQSMEEARRAGINPDAPPASVAEGTRLTSRGPVSIVGRSQVDASTQTDAPAAQTRTAPGTVTPAVTVPTQSQARPAHRLLTTTAMRAQAARDGLPPRAPFAAAGGTSNTPTLASFDSIDLQNFPFYDPDGAVRDAIARLAEPRSGRPNTIQLSFDADDRELIMQAHLETRRRMARNTRRSSRSQTANVRNAQVEAAARNDRLMDQVIAQRRAQPLRLGSGTVEPLTSRQIAAPSSGRPLGARRGSNQNSGYIHIDASRFQNSYEAWSGQRRYIDIPDLESLDHD